MDASGPSGRRITRAFFRREGSVWEMMRTRWGGHHDLTDSVVMEVSTRRHTPDTLVPIQHLYHPFLDRVTVSEVRLGHELT